MKTITLLLLFTQSVYSQTPFKIFNGLDDKLKHEIVSTSIAWPATIFATRITNRPVLGAAIAYALTFGLGLGKELIHDKLMHRGTYSGGDIGADAFGTGVGVAAGVITLGVANEVKRVQTENYENLNVPNPLINP